MSGKPPTTDNTAQTTIMWKIPLTTKVNFTQTEKMKAKEAFSGTPTTMREKEKRKARHQLLQQRGKKSRQPQRRRIKRNKQQKIANTQTRTIEIKEQIIQTETIDNKKQPVLQTKTIETKEK